MKRFFLPALLLISTFATYAPALKDGFVWDDTALILRDPLIRSWRLIPEGFNHYLFTDATPSDFYRPLQRLTYTLEYAVFTARPGPYHLTSIFIHGFAAIALMLFATALLQAFGCEKPRARWIGFLSALIWAIHPVHSSAVVYVSGRADPLAALFGFGGLYLILKSLVRPRLTGILLVAAGAVSFLCSVLSKESGFIFPVVMLLLLAVLKQRRALQQFSLAILVVVAAYFSLRMPAEHIAPPAFGLAPPAALRPITMSRAVAEYAGLLIFPVNLHMERDVNAPFTTSLYRNTAASAARELQTLAGVIISIGILLWVFHSRRRDPATFVLLLSAMVAYVPISGVMRLNASVAEHWIYVPSAFLLIALVLTATRLTIPVIRVRSLRPVATAFCAVWMFFLSVRTFIRTFDWKDQRTFVERTIAAGGSSVRMLVNLGALESSENRLDLAEAHLTQALKREPEHPFATIDLAAVLVKQNKFDSARSLLGKATGMPVVAARAHELLAIVESKQNGKADLLRLRLAARTEFSDWAIERRYIKLLAETGFMDKAVGELQMCLQTEWYRAESWQLLAQLLGRMGQSKGAAEAMAIATSYDVHLSARPAAL